MHHLKNDASYRLKPLLKKSFRLTPASQGSGHNDTSINHDTVLAQFTLPHNHPLAKFSGILSDLEAKELQQAIN